MYIPSAQHWRKMVSRGKYPLLFIYELNRGLLKSHLIASLKTKMTNYCRIEGGSYLDEKQAQAFIKELRKILNSQPQKAFDWIEKYYHYSRNLLEWLEKINSKVKNRKLSKKDLKNIYRNYEKQVSIIWRWAYLPFLIDEAIALELNELLAKLDLTPQKISEALKILTVSSKLNFYQKEEIELLILADKVKRLGLAGCRRQIKNHSDKWAWKQSWIYSQHPLTEKELEAEISNLIKANPAKVLADLIQGRKDKIKQKKLFLNRFKNRKLKILADILSEYALWHSIKMGEMTKAVFLIKPFFDQLAKELGLTYDQFIELIPEEVEKEKINLSVIRGRIKENGVVMINGRWRIISGRRISQVRKIIEKRLASRNILKGYPTYPGKIIGRVVIVSEAVNISQLQFKPGEILVAAMTTTNMVPLVKKAAAVITDEGGVLCHAAIITRELKKPCVTGTKFATKIFKTGDLVEVDANKGVVKIIR